MLIKIGTSVQQVDASFNTTAELEIYDPVNLGDNDGLLGKVTTPDRFHSVAWGSFGYNTGAHENGVIAGGMDNGTVCIWDANKIMNNEQSLILEGRKHTGPVRTVEFNHYQPNVLAS
eukprot:Pgem_evm1s4721